MLHFGKPSLFRASDRWQVMKPLTWNFSIADDSGV
jgi:hypothetical protein